MAQEPEPQPLAVAMRGIIKRFPGVVANDGIDLTVRQGEILARSEKVDQTSQGLAGGDAIVEIAILSGIDERGSGIRVTNAAAPPSRIEEVPFALFRCRKREVHIREVELVLAPQGQLKAFDDVALEVGSWTEIDAGHSIQGFGEVLIDCTVEEGSE